MDDSSDIYERNHSNVLFPNTLARGSAQGESQITLSSMNDSTCDATNLIQVNLRLAGNKNDMQQTNTDSNKDYQIVKKNGMDVIQNSGMSSSSSSDGKKKKRRRKGTKNTKNSQPSIESFDSANEYKKQYNHPIFPFKERNQGKLFANPDACQQYFMK